MVFPKQTVHVSGESARPGHLPWFSRGDENKGHHRLPSGGHHGHRQPAAPGDSGGRLGRSAGLEGCFVWWWEATHGSGSSLLPQVRTSSLCSYFSFPLLISLLALFWFFSFHLTHICMHSHFSALMFVIQKVPHNCAAWWVAINWQRLIHVNLESAWQNNDDYVDDECFYLCGLLTECQWLVHPLLALVLLCDHNFCAVTYT